MNKLQQNDEIEGGCKHNKVDMCNECQKCDQMRKKFLGMIDEIFTHIQVSGNSHIQNTLQNVQVNIERAFYETANEVFLIQANAEMIFYKLEDLLRFAENKKNLETITMGLTKNAFKKQLMDQQTLFSTSLQRFNKFLKRLQQQDISKSEFKFDGGDEAVIKYANFNFIFESLDLNQQEVVQIIQSLVFQEIDAYTDIYNHVVGAKKFIKKAQQLKDLQILQNLEQILAVTIQKQEKVVILQIISPNQIGYSPKLFNEDNSDQAIYLSAGMKLRLTKNYEIRIVEVCLKTEITVIPENMIVKLDEKGKQNVFEEQAVEGTNSYLTIQEWINGVGFTPLTIYQQQQEKGSISLNHLLELPQNVQVDVCYDKNGFYFHQVSEKVGFYPSLHFDGQLISIPKEINFVLVINNELRVHIRSDGGEVLDDSEIRSRSIV